MKRSLILILFLSAILLSEIFGNISHSLALNPEKQTEQLLTAIQHKDFKGIFEITSYYQNQVAAIKSKNPKVLWEKLITEYYEEKKKTFLGSKGEDIADASLRSGAEFMGAPTDPMAYLRTLNGLVGSAEWKVLESKRQRQRSEWDGRIYETYLVYVSFSYKEVMKSPLMESKFLKEAIFGFEFNADTGLYMRSYNLSKGNTYWDKIPLKILSIRWWANQISGLMLFVKPIGGTLKYKSVTRCGKWILEAQREANIYMADDESICTAVKVAFPNQSFPMECISTLTDSTQEKDTVAFVVPNMFGSFCWVADPWRQWRQGVPKLCSSDPFELKAAKEMVGFGDSGSSKDAKTQSDRQQTFQDKTKTDSKQPPPLPGFLKKIFKPQPATK